MKPLKTASSLLRPSFLALAVTAGLSLSACTASGDVEQESPAVEQDIPSLLAAYSKGWSTQDVDAIIALHTDDTQFRIMIGETPPANGKEELRVVLESIFASNPNYSSTPRSVRIGENFAVIEYNMNIDPNLPSPVGKFVFTPKGEPYSIPTIDVIEFENGLVKEKITYLDMETGRANSLSVEPIE